MFIKLMFDIIPEYTNVVIDINNISYDYSLLNNTDTISLNSNSNSSNIDNNHTIASDIEIDSSICEFIKLDQTLERQNITEINSTNNTDFIDLNTYKYLKKSSKKKLDNKPILSILHEIDDEF